MNRTHKKLNVLIAYNEPEQQKRDTLDYLSEAAVKDEADIVYQVLKECGHSPSLLGISSLEQIFHHIAAFQPDVIFNLCEGFQGKTHQEMFVAGLWELLEIPYTGNPPLTLGLAQDKVLAKRLFETRNIPTPRFEVYTEPPTQTVLTFPLIAKPSREDASLGILHGEAVVNTLEKLRHRVKELIRNYRQPILVEEFIQGREFNISLLGNRLPRVVAISEISFAELDENTPHITSYEAKWLTDHALYRKTPAICPAPIDHALQSRLEQVALDVYNVLGGRDYGRVDTRVDANGNIFVLEYNPNPDISPDAGFVRALTAAGISYREFVELLIKEALDRKIHAKH
ncbi:MAG: ATP-grasp domain-containing protein [candidate division KSB1 bacterium]|nr:ATP-grasp domain-containing protein [candidate division KSB1 bacterium]MDZ7318010.1 ATP-grasp domain-containing protein [candidate division KSB1 bacterium]MDZ7341579.1 ATP-grasp domain-containing protein [candidate division KSB1 bacterium]